MNIFGWLTVLFVGLKLTHFIDWSWWMVLSPIWANISIFIAISFLQVLADSDAPISRLKRALRRNRY